MLPVQLLRKTPLLTCAMAQYLALSDSCLCLLLEHPITIVYSLCLIHMPICKRQERTVITVKAGRKTALPAYKLALIIQIGMYFIAHALT